MSLRSSSGRRPTSACSAASRWTGSPATASASRSQAASTTGRRSSWAPGSRRAAGRRFACSGSGLTPATAAETRAASWPTPRSRCSGRSASMPVPQLVDPDPAALVEAAETATIVVTGLPASWRRDGLREARRALVRRSRPTLLVHSGPRPSGLAPAGSRTRFTWTIESPHLAAGSLDCGDEVRPALAVACAPCWAAILCRDATAEIVRQILRARRSGSDRRRTTVTAASAGSCGWAAQPSPYACFISSIVEHGPIPAAVRCSLFQVVMMSARSGLCAEIDADLRADRT